MKTRAPQTAETITEQEAAEIILRRIETADMAEITIGPVQFKSFIPPGTRLRVVHNTDKID